MLKFRYAPIPVEVLGDPSLSWKMKGRYGLLLGRAFNREVLDLSLEQIAELWSEAEGEAIDPDSVGWYLGQMAKAGLIRRVQKDRYRWRTFLLMRYISQKERALTIVQPSSTAATVQPQSSPVPPQPQRSHSHSAATAQSDEPLRQSQGLRTAEGPVSGALITNQQKIAVDDDVWSQIDQLQQHHQLLTVAALLNLGISPDTALEFALRCPWGVVKAWICYALDKEGIRDPAGFVVAMLGQGKASPLPPLPGSPRAERYLVILQDLGVPR